ncbi:MAG: DEAD/DEAH box helicase, partial [Candidatus Rokubacteria bacterium]|nr:DEAD/DEAH box helicase [Candidatus Rokubacteria bacterium]
MSTALELAALDLPEPVQRGIRDAGFVTATAIQEAALPLALKGKDVAGQSQTGTGKTAAFLIAAFTRCLRHPAPARNGPTAPRVLIIAPTRELVVQIRADAQLLGAHTGLRILAVYGGVDYAKQRDELGEACDVLVGTPGRLIDYLKQLVWSPARVEVLVIDEADRLFDMGFIADLRFILRKLPKPEKRQSFLFSATLSFRVMELTWEFMNNPTQITITPHQKTAEKVEHLLYHVGRHEKLPLLLGLLQREKPERALFFVNTKREAEWLANRLEDNGHHAAALTGDLHQR